ncbi:MAG TPA: protein-glutamate O-methyltransferase CheR, partial [Kofleriaceae bacterium]|nr:protein-glutamate O-methyltransferase CheR [Kofleriaceae bacterium]
MAVVEALSSLVERVTGFSLVATQLELRLLPFVAERAAALSLGSPLAYVRMLEGEGSTGEEWRRLIEVLTNGQTSFFRDGEQFAAIGELLRGQRGARPLQIWSAGCSTGEEPYSLAIVCAELGVSARIVASDLNRQFLARAADGWFSEWAVRKVDPERRRRWFERGPRGLRVAAPLRAMVELRPHNLVSEEPPRSSAPDGRWDLILCRNVFIYFDKDTQLQVLRKFAALQPLGAYLCLGH